VFAWVQREFLASFGMIHRYFPLVLTHLSSERVHLSLYCELRRQSQVSRSCAVESFFILFYLTLLVL
jgi:hypothetical protein